MQEIADDHYLLVAAVDAGIRRGVLGVQDATSHRAGGARRSCAWAG